MGRSSREESIRTRETLLTVSRRLFLAQGYDAVGLEEVARAAGVTRGAVYHHFGGKQRLYEEVVAGLHRALAGRVRSAAEDAGPGWPGIIAGCLAFLDGAGAPEVRRTLLVEAPAVLGWQHWRAVDADHSRALLEEGLRALEDSGELARGSAPAVAILISGAVNEAALWLAEAPDEGARVQVDEALRGLLAGLRR